MHSGRFQIAYTAPAAGKIRVVDFLLAFVVTAFAATSGWIVWGGYRAVQARTRRRHELALAREHELTERRRLELREAELADEVYRDFRDHHRTPPDPTDPPC